MLLSLILPLLVQGASATPHQASEGPKRVDKPRIVRSLVDTVDPADMDEDPRSLGTLAASSAPVAAGAAVGVTLVNPISLGWQLGGNPLVMDIMLSNLGTTFGENFLLQVPVKHTAKPRPLLMVFHKYGSKANDPYLNTSFPKECFERNWFMLSSLGASKKSFSSLQSQIHRDASLAWVLKLFGRRIDRKRIYGVGFSMGGGSVVNWAARHLEPNGVRMAALVNHTGGVALEDTWKNEVQEIKDLLLFWHNGTPVSSPFSFQRSSTMSYVAGTDVADPKRSMGLNLTHMPMMIMNATQDPLNYLVQQTKRFKDFMVGAGGKVAYSEVPGNQHSWAILNERRACDFLAGFREGLPLSGRTVADRTGGWFWFDVVQDVADKFTTFRWTIDPSVNALRIEATTNLNRIGGDLSAMPLDVTAPLTVEIEALDLFTDFVDLRGFTAKPSAVTRDGVPTSGWQWKPGIETVTLVEQSLGKHIWVIQP